jgi:hypothetical protein
MCVYTRSGRAPGDLPQLAVLPGHGPHAVQRGEQPLAQRSLPRHPQPQLGEGGQGLPVGIARHLPDRDRRVPEDDGRRADVDEQVVLDRHRAGRRHGEVRVLGAADPHQRQPLGDARLDQPGARDLGQPGSGADVERGVDVVPHRLGNEGPRGFAVDGGMTTL